MAKKKKMKIMPILMILVILLAGASGCYLWYKSPAEATISQNVTIEIPNGASTKAIATLLANEGLVKNSYSFVEFVKDENAASDLRSGSYTFTAGTLSYDDILSVLLKGTYDTENLMNITFAEGLTVPQMAEVFEGYGLGTAEEFLDYCANLEIPYDYIPAGDDYNQLEGFLFPETYNIVKTWGAQEVVDMMLKQFDTVWTDEYDQRAAELNMTVHEVVILASLIEREAQVAEERALVSSVIHNRLDIDMLLQICATVLYIKEEPSGVVLYSDLEIDDPYNTYMYLGLPPGAICSPGAACIEAALYPEDTNYFYYRTKEDGSGGHNFSETYAEHLANDPN